MMMAVMDPSTIYVIAGGVGIGGAAFVGTLWKIVVGYRNGKTPDPEKLPLSCGKANETYVRKDICDHTREHVERTLDNVQADVKAIMKHHGVPPPNLDENGRRT